MEIKEKEMAYLSHKTKQEEEEEDRLDQEENVEAFHGHREVYQSDNGNSNVWNTLTFSSCTEEWAHKWLILALKYLYNDVPNDVQKQKWLLQKP